jgi:hypothetical protein
MPSSTSHRGNKVRCTVLFSIEIAISPWILDDYNALDENCKINTTSAAENRAIPRRPELVHSSERFHRFLFRHHFLFLCSTRFS